MYEVSYQHEDFSVYISPIDGDNYSSIKFNDNAMNAKDGRDWAAINNYDIVSELGEENIWATIGPKYEECYKKKGVW